MSLEGLSSLIQLESTRLEGARATTQNFQSVASTIQQQGMQTASSKNNLAMSRIDAQYTKECAEADVRKIEKRLARERASEALSKNIAGIAMIANAVGNLGHMFNDINGRQKLGDSPEYLKTPAVNPNDLENTHVRIQQDPNSGASAVYAFGKNDDGSETVYSYTTGKDGVSVGSPAMAANISEYDKERILGDDYTKLRSDKNNGKPIDFEKLLKLNPELADKLVQARSHSVSGDEAENLMKILEVQVPKTNITTSTSSKSQNDSINTENAGIVSGISSITNPDDKIIEDSFNKKDANKIAQLQSAFDKLPLETRTKIAGNETSLINIINDPNKSKDLKTNLTNNTEFMKSLEEQSSLFPTGNVYQSQPSEKNKNNQDIQINNKGLTFKIKDISSEDKAKLGDEYKNMSFDKIFEADPAKAKELIGNVVQEKFDKLTEDEKSKILLDMGIANQPEKFKDTFIGKMDNNPELANSVVKSIGSSNRIEPLNVSQAIQNTDSAGANKRLQQSTESLKDNLIKSGKIDDKGVVGKAKDVGKAAVNFLVKTMEESVPYFQAYLKAKERADRTYEELVAAKEKLNAANKKLKAIEMQIDVFSGRGA